MNANAGRNKSYFVYILGNETGILYTGVTNDLERWVGEHKAKQIKGFTSKYGATRLLYYEEFHEVEEAITAEKVIKGWLRKKKIELIREGNPTFRDLSEDWGVD